MDLISVTGALQSLPISIQHRMQQAASSLIGAVTKIPKAWIDAKAQSISDKASASQAMQKALVEAAKKQLKTDDELINATVEAYLPSAIQKARNRVNVLHEAAEQLHEENWSAASGPDAAEAPLDEDWMNMFARQAEDASSERMRGLLGKILAGEIRQPGSFSPSTLRVVAEMDQEMAADLQRLAELAVGDVVFTDESWSSGEKFLFASRLALHGFTTASVDQVSRKIDINAEGAGGMALGNVVMIIQAAPNQTISAQVLLLTKSGMQLKSLLPPPANPLQLITASAAIIKSSNPSITEAHLNLPTDQQIPL